MGLMALTLALLVSPANAASDDADAAFRGQWRSETQGVGVRYVAVIQGVTDKEVLSLLREVSKTVQGQATPTPSVFLLSSRAESDLAAFKDVFHSRGFFTAKATVAVDETTDPVRVVFKVEPGEVFLLREVRFSLPPGEGNRKVEFPSPKSLGLLLDAPFSAKSVLNAQEGLLRHFQENGRPFPRIMDRKVTADFAARSVVASWQVDVGPDATFWKLTIEGLTDVDPAVVRREIPWEEGQRYDVRLVNDLRTRLTALDLFSTIEAEPDKDIDPSGKTAVTLRLTERKHRTFKGGADYKSDEGPGFNLGWEHRNLFGNGERLTLSAGASLIRQFGEAVFELPAFLRPDQKLTTKARYVNEELQAYTGVNFTAASTLRRTLREHLTTAAGLGFRYSEVAEDKSRPWESGKDYQFLFVPLEAALDSRDDPLDPQKGFLVNLSAAPYANLTGGADFLRPEINAAVYLRLLDTPDVVFANRAYVGADMGASLDELPSDLRFYAGGGGSIRGYPYQTVGPLRSKTPTGGRSVFTFSSELRVRLSEYLGVVPFLDGGSAFSNVLPPYEETLRFGVGVGIRVYTPIGPIRLDVATPLNRRQNIDDVGQFYISIGQAF
ncbi:BamA/TamA family outer membrane protein [Desulfolutivibrio sulfoxidireducens]|nr:BamA/TamA family outer membrane protein [Desulfolutivibrio sulfoxidireducens]